MSFWGPFEAFKPMADFQFGSTRQGLPARHSTSNYTITPPQRITREMAEHIFQQRYGSVKGTERMSDADLLGRIQTQYVIDRT